VTAAGYSGTPLARKLGLGAGETMVTIGAPAEYERWLAPLPAKAKVTAEAPESPRAVHLFTTSRAELGRELVAWRTRLAENGYLWISWPKRVSKVPTDVTEDVIRELALPLGFVDVKVCAVSEVWSGLKLVIRKELRGR
jgi:hypothetical protein